MNNQIVFGAGCFHFGVKKRPPFVFKGQDYIDNLQKALERISTVDKIRIEANSDFKELELEVKEELSTIDEGTNFLPPPAYHLEIDFEIYIPKRIQDDLSPLRLPINLNTERFRIHIHYTYFFPVTFIEAISPTDDCSPSDAIVVVREFLEKQFEEIASDYLSFECLGPSPFHADFVLETGEGNNESEDAFDNNGYLVEHIQQHGYDAFYFYYAPSLYENLDEAKSRLFFLLGNELGLFYRMIHRDILQMASWATLQEKFEALLELQKAKGLRAIRNSLWQNYKQIHNVAITVAEFESKQIWTEYFFKNEYRDLIEKGKVPYIDSYFKQTIQRLPNYPTGQIRDIITLLENRRSKSVENVIVIISAVLGGIIGSLITLLLTRP